MKNLKLMLPMLAFIMAIGMSFAFVNKASDENLYATKYVLLDPSDPSNPESWAAIEIECGAGPQNCTVTYQPSGETFEVYDTPSLNNRAESNTEVVTIVGTPPTLN
ncbi:DUF6520 family protein [Galbibacter sp. PAP.153]|uniref:DUF6520 family protein n=1 Tax=Galbibacter sp. PAP.153 TaxID=3104623 RepID=UPI00300903C4